MRIKSAYTLLLLTLPTLIVVVVVLVLMYWHIPTRIHIDLTVNRVVFTVGGTDPKPILNPGSFQSITVERFASIKLSPKKLEIADPVKYILRENRYPESSWSSLAVTPPVVITGEDETLQPKVTFESSKTGLNINGKMDIVLAKPGSEVTLEVRGTRASNLTIKVDGQESSSVLSFREPFRVITEYGKVSGIMRLPYQSNSLTYRVQLPNHSPFVEINGQLHSFVLALTIPSEKIINLFSAGEIPIVAISFISQDEMGNPVTTLVKGKESKITYPKYPKIGKIMIKTPDLIELGQLNRFNIKEIALDPEHKGIRLRLDGIARQLRTGSREFPEDHRLTFFNALWQNPGLMILFSIIVWVLLTTVGGYRFFKEVER
jgi:hypothetical protein